MSTSRSRRLLLAAALWLLLLGLGARAYLHVERAQQVDRLCQKVTDGDWRGAISGTADLVGYDAPGLRAAECRATAFVLSGQPQEATAQLDELLADPRVGDWLPGPEPLQKIIAERRSSGRLPAAAELARRGTAAYPEDGNLLFLELDVRSEIESEDQVLAEFVERLPRAGKSAPLLRIYLAQLYAKRREFAKAAELFGDEPPAAAALAKDWYLARIDVAGLSGDVRQLAEVCRQWAAHGGEKADILALHAATLSVYRLTDPDYPTLPMLELAVKSVDQLGDKSIASLLYQRLIGTLGLVGRFDKALAYFDSAPPEVHFRFTRDELVRSFEQHAFIAMDEEEQRRPDRRGTLLFVVEPPLRGAALRLSAEPAMPADSDFESLPLPATGRLETTRGLVAAPVRWVLAGGDGSTLASGAVWPTRNAVVEVDVRPGPAQKPREFSPRQAPGDGRRRVIDLVLDCADWHLVQYLRARGDLPVLDWMLRHGRRAVLDSQPPFTAAAMDELVYPARRRALSPAAAIYRLGAELADNIFIEANPFSPLGWILPESSSLFETVGGGRHVALNLLFSEGNVHSGEHGEIIGPGARVRVFTDWRRRRPLTAAESEILPVGVADVGLAEETAAALDAAARVVASHGDIDLLMLRVDPLDTITHTQIASASQTRQDDGKNLLYDLYRYLDHRIGEIFQLLDEDDVLVIMSDHGILTNVEHDHLAVFVAAGGGITAGRVSGTPDLRGVPRMLAELLGVETPWPRTGIESWVEELP